MDNKEKYKLVKAKLETTPGLSESRACKDLDASYVGYRYWAKKYGNKKKEEEGDGTKKAINEPNKSPIDLTTIADAVIKGQKELKVDVMAYVASLDTPSLKELVQLMALKKRNS